jgi:quercetin dioxygenase-like cupin family protein
LTAGAAGVTFESSDGEERLAGEKRKAVEAGEKHEVLLFMNDRARLLRLTVAAGEKVERHFHPNHLMYVLRASRIRITMPNGDVQEYEGKAGDSTWLEAGDYEAENLGDGEFEAVLFEIR